MKKENKQKIILLYENIKPKDFKKWQKAHPEYDPTWTPKEIIKLMAMNGLDYGLDN